MEQAVQQMAMVTEKQSQEGCLFCRLVNYRNREILVENESLIVVLDNFPVNKGHTLIIAKRHIATPFQLFNYEGIELLEILSVAKRILDERFEPDGYNLGINSGQAAGQTIPHLHIHLIPRYNGDVENPRGGIRNFKPALVPY